MKPRCLRPRIVILDETTPELSQQFKDMIVAFISDQIDMTPSRHRRPWLRPGKGRAKSFN